MSSTPPGDLPPPPSSAVPPPPPPPSTPQTQIVGQQAAPSTSVPHTPGLQPQGMGAGATGQTNTLAVVSLVAAIGSFFAHIIPGVGGFTVALVAAITGYMARNQIKQTGEQGYGMATAGMIIGIVHMSLIVVGVILLVLIFIFGIALFGIAASHSSG